MRELQTLNPPFEYQFESECLYFHLSCIPFVYQKHLYIFTEVIKLAYGPPIQMGRTIPANIYIYILIIQILILLEMHEKGRFALCTRNLQRRKRFCIRFYVGWYHKNKIIFPVNHMGSVLKLYFEIYAGLAKQLYWYVLG